MRKIVIFGNSGSGKSSLARELHEKYQLAHLDLDVIAWQPTEPPTRKPLPESAEVVHRFTSQHSDWVIEGCYSDLLQLVMNECNEVIFLNLSVEQCIENAKNRPWEPHKYRSKEAQDANLSMLVDWISQYPNRADTFSQSAHRALFDGFIGKKTELIANTDWKIFN